MDHFDVQAWADHQNRLISDSSITVPFDHSAASLDVIQHRPISHARLNKMYEQLDQKVSKDQTLKRPGPNSIALTYLPAYQAIRNSNHVFGPDGWACEIKSLDSTEKLETVGNKKEYLCISKCIMKVFAMGTFHEDVGHGNARMPSPEMAREKAEKEAVSDARKRALKNFGEYLGNSLYDKKHLADLSSVSLIKK